MGFQANEKSMSIITHIHSAGGKYCIRVYLYLPFIVPLNSMSSHMDISYRSHQHAIRYTLWNQINAIITYMYFKIDTCGYRFVTWKQKFTLIEDLFVCLICVFQSANLQYCISEVQNWCLEKHFSPTFHQIVLQVSLYLQRTKIDKFKKSDLSFISSL